MATYKHEHTHITTPEPDKIIEFYTKVMGARVTKEIESAGRRLTDIDLGGIPVRISSATGADKDWTGLRYGLHHLGLEVDNMDEFIAKIKANSVEIVTAPFQPGPGVKAAFIKARTACSLRSLKKARANPERAQTYPARLLRASAAATSTAALRLLGSAVPFPALP